MPAPLTFTQAATGALFSVRYPLVSDVDVLPVQVLTFGNIEQRSMATRKRLFHDQTTHVSGSTGH